MVPADDPGFPPPPPGRPPAGPAPVAPAPGTTPAPAAPTGRGGPNPWLLLVVGLIVGLAAGGGGGYLAFHTSNSSAPLSARSSATAMPSPTPAATTTAAPATPTAAAPTAAVLGVVPCPVTAPAGQHALGTPGPAGAGQHVDATLDFCGMGSTGSATIPTGSIRFTTNGNWGLGIAHSCPPGSAGSGGMDTVLTVNEVLPGGGAGPDSATEVGDWADGGAVLMASGGSFQLTVTVVAPSCVWAIDIYPS